MNELEILTLERPVTVRGEEIIVKPYSWANTFRMAKPLKTVLDALYNNADNIDRLVASSMEDDATKACRALIDTVANIDNADELLDAIAIMIGTGAGKPKDYILALDIDELFALGSAVYGVNKDFFTQKGSKIKEALNIQ